MGKFDRVFHLLTRIQINIYTFPKAKLNHMLTKHFHSNTIDLLSWNKILSCHVNNGRFQDAQKVFDEMPVRDVVSWNTVLLGFRNAKDPKKVYECFLRMLRAGLIPSGHTISLVLSSAVLGTEFNALVPQFHGLAVRLSLADGLFVGSALMRGYAELGDPVALNKVFHDVYDKDVSTWNTLVSGYTRLGLVVEARRVFEAMPERNVVSWTSMINGYICANQISQARCLFDSMSEKNVVSWTAMIGGYVQSRRFSDALELFASMLRSSSFRPNAFTFSTVLVACSGQSSLFTGRQIHSSIAKHGPPRNDVVLLSSLVDMYAKCGDIDSASQVFEAIPEKNAVTWNAIIGGYARHGLAERALEEFERMTTRTSYSPDRVTFVNVLSGCVHGGLVEEAEKIFHSMAEKYGVKAGPEHYACMVDLYGRVGLVEKAAKLVDKMPVEPDIVVWGALLTGSRSGQKSVENKYVITS